MELHGFLPIDKPLGWTSHDVVARLRGVVGTRRVGHAGTLDPAATGVLVVGVGRATRFLDLVQQERKEYFAHIVLGSASDTADIDGRLMSTLSSEAQHSREAVELILTQFVGEIDQIPPKYSAVKQGGEPLYKRMRRGEQVDVPIRQVRIDCLQVISYEYPDLIVRIRCASGVYVRSLAEDIGAALDSGAYLHHLLRTGVGAFTLRHCWTMSELESTTFPNGWTLVSTATDAGITSLPAFALDRRQSDAWYHGRLVSAVNRRLEDADALRVYTDEGTFAGLGAIQESDPDRVQVRPRTVLASH